MCTQTLVVIGNGFDLMHGIKSSFLDFKEFIEKNNEPLWDVITRSFEAHELWSNFEENLANIDLDILAEEHFYNWNTLGDYNYQTGDEQPDDLYLSDLEEDIVNLTQTLKKCFEDWIDNIQIQKVIRMLDFHSESRFLTFNYTKTLEQIYGVSPNKVHHIHGKVPSSQSEIVLGHSRKEEFSVEEADSEFFGGWGWNAEETVELYNEYYSNNFKNIENVIIENLEYFDSLSDVKQVEIIGHSLSEVDLGYFEILKNVILPSAAWRVSYYSDKSIEMFTKRLLKLGVSEEQFELVNVRKHPLLIDFQE